MRVYVRLEGRMFHFYILKNSEENFIILCQEKLTQENDTGNQNRRQSCPQLRGKPHGVF